MQSEPGDERTTEAGQGPRGEPKSLRLPLRASAQEGTHAAHAGVKMVEEGVLDNAEDWDALINQAQRDPCVGKIVHEVQVGRPVCGAMRGGDWWVPSRSGVVRGKRD